MAPYLGKISFMQLFVCHTRVEEANLQPDSSQNSQFCSAKDIEKNSDAYAAQLWFLLRPIVLWRQGHMVKN